MRSMKDILVKKERFEALRTANLARLNALPEVQQARSMLTPPDARICEVCLGFGFIGYGVGKDDPNFGKVQACPAENCEARTRLAKERAAKMQDALPKNYRDYTFESWWEQVPQHQQAGKYLPFYTARYMAEHLKQAFSLSQVLAAVGVPFEAFTDANGVPRLRANIRGTVEVFQDSYASSLVFEGLYGTSKTGLAVALLNLATQFGYSTATIDLPKFIQAIQDTYNRDFDHPLEARAKLLAPIETADLVLIDEGNVAEGKDSGEASEDKIKIFTEFIVKPRWHAVDAKPFVFTTNKPYPEFVTHWGERATVRITERAHWLRFLGLPIRHRNEPV